MKEFTARPQAARCEVPSPYLIQCRHVIPSYQRRNSSGQLRYGPALGDIAKVNHAAQSGLAGLRVPLCNQIVVRQVAVDHLTVKCESGQYNQDGVNQGNTSYTSHVWHKTLNRLRFYFRFFWLTIYSCVYLIHGTCPTILHLLRCSFRIITQNDHSLLITNQ